MHAEMDDKDAFNGTVQRPTKRPRLSYTAESPDDVEEVSGEWDLQAARVQNDLRLKSIFERIFAKYGKDFSDVADEIDMESGEIVVNKGHLLGIQEETDIGNKESPWEVDSLGSDGSEDEAPPAKSYDVASERSPRNKLSGSGTDGNASAPLCDSALPSSGREPGIPASGPSVLKEKLSAALHHIEKDPGPRDPLWLAPELPPLFTTPKVDKRWGNLTPQLPNIPRQPSPPGSGSLWTVPRRRQPRMGQDGKSTTTPSPSKRRPPAKRKHQSSPVARDWSFAKVADSDSDESDDPLQEEWPSSPLSFPRQIKFRKWRSGNHHITISDKTPDTEPINTRRVGASCESLSQAESSVHNQSGTEPERDDQGNHSEQRPEVSHHGPVKYDNLPRDSPSPISPHSSTAAHSPAKCTPIKAGNKFSPDEIKLLVCMRYVQGSNWKDILDALPGHTMTKIYQWNQVHWSDRRARPPELSAPWSQAELKTLESLADRSGLSWLEIMAELSERSQGEVEFELLRCWVGDDVWEGAQHPALATGTIDSAPFGSVKYETENKVIMLEPGDDEDNVSDASATTIEESKAEETTTVEKPQAVEENTVGLPSPRIHHQYEFEDLLESDGDHHRNEVDDVMLVSGASSPSKLSAIHLESPLPSRYMSTTRSPKNSPLKYRDLI